MGKRKKIRIILTVEPSELEEINEYCSANKINRSAFFRIAAQFYLDAKTDQLRDKLDFNWEQEGDFDTFEECLNSYLEEIKEAVNPYEVHIPSLLRSEEFEMSLEQRKDFAEKLEEIKKILKARNTKNV
jgi:hypothetical protein